MNKDKIRLLALGKEEYTCLQRDFAVEAVELYPFEVWFKDVFLVSETWAEVRNNYK